MSKQLHISTTLSLPVELAAQAACIVGLRGSGKTNTARAMAEELLKAGVPICVIDPTDAWWGLRSSRDGKGDGFPVFIFGGEHGDLPLEETHGKTIAEFLVAERVPVVLSLRHLRKGAQRRFVTDLCEELYHLKGKPGNRSPLAVFVDEARLFVPQQVTGDMARTVGAVEDLVTLGRNAGFGVTLISQRFATINKNVSTQAGVIIAHRLTSPQDRKSLAEWIEENATIEQQRETLASLATLKDGEAWIWAPGLDVYRRVQMRLSETFDSGATPKMGTKPVEPKKLAEIDTDKLKARMSAAVEQKKANDPAELKKKLAAAEKALAVAQNAKPAPAAKAKVVEKPVITDKQIERLEAIQERAWQRVEAWWKRASSGINPLMELLNGQKVEIIELRHAINAATAAAPPATFHVNTRDAAGRRQPLEVRQEYSTPARTAAPAGTGDLTRPQRRILDAIAWWNSIGVAAPSRSQVGFVAGIKPTGGHFTNTIGPLSTGGYIEYTGEGVRLTDAGAAIATVPETQTTLASYHAMIRRLLKKGPSQRIFDAIVSCGGEPIAIAQIGEDAGIDPAGGHFTNSIGPLGTLGLIDRRDGVATPTKLLYPEGLR